MALKAKQMKSQFKRPDPLEAGTYPARLVQVLTLGLQPQRPFKGEEKPPVDELMVTYEFLDEFLTDEETGEELLDKPRWLSEDFPFYPLSSDKAKSSKRYHAFDPKEEFDGDWSEILGDPCLVTIVQNPGKGANEGVIYENVAGVSAMRGKDADKAEELKNPPKLFNIDEPDMEIFLSLPEWIQDKMKSNLNFEGSALERAIKNHKGSVDSGAPTKDEDQDEIPFDEDNEEVDW